METIRHLVRDESAATAIEYALIATLISVALIAGLTAYADSANELWTFVAETVVKNL